MGGSIPKVSQADPCTMGKMDSGSEPRQEPFRGIASLLVTGIARIPVKIPTSFSRKTLVSSVVGPYVM